MLDLDIFGRRHGQVQVQLLWPWAVRPRRFRQLGHLLEGQQIAAVAVSQHQPVLVGGTRR
jgi:hypothetical protein